MEVYYFIALVIVSSFSVFVGYQIRRNLTESKLVNAEELSDKIVKEAEKEAETKRREASLEAKDKFGKRKLKFEQEIKERRQELALQENQLNSRKENIRKRYELLDKKESDLLNKEDSIRSLQENLAEKERDCDELLVSHRVALERVSQISAEEAKEELKKLMEAEARRESAIKLRMIEEETKETAHKQAHKIISTAIGRIASEQVAETTVSAVVLPSNDMKGRIIGREGRNIRALEKATGIDLIIDDTPDTVVLSGFDAVRREVARISLDRLINDGRIHPARIEEVVNKVRKEMDQNIKETGEQATYDVNIHGIHPELIKTLGRLKYRTSYSQNVLQHSLEVAFLAGMMASELGVDGKLAKRAGLLHDLGKAIDHSIEGPHDQIGADLARKYRESPVVVNAIAAHHEAVEYKSVEAVLVQAADALSAARPGVRRENLGSYIQRMENLEEIARSFSGINRSYAIQAGRELRIMVDQKKVSDKDSGILARDIAHKIEGELKYPGQVKVTVIRESRAVEYAK
ncbi:MAG: ribonuclease Y [bacterium]